MRHYSFNAYRQLFQEGQKQEGRQLLPEDNEDHYCAEPNFFEWWYFDIAFDDGSWLVAALHSASYCMGDHKPTIDLCYYPVAGPPVMATGRFPRSEYEATQGHFRIRIGESWAAAENGVYRLHLSQGPLEAELIFHPQLPGVKVGSGHLFADKSGGTYFNWVVPVPRAYVKGTLRIRGENCVVEGVGYHDHNWGNIYLRNAFRDWVWGRVWGDKCNLVFGDLTPKGGALQVRPLLLGNNGKVCEIKDGFRLRRQCITKDDSAETIESHHLSLEAEGEFDVSLSLTLLKPMETAQIAALRSWLVPWRRLVEPLFYLTQQMPMLGQVLGALVGKGLYYRWPARGILRIDNKEIEVQGLVEKMELEPERDS